ncbi:lysoplasmalogenase [Cytobacillus firmus]|uniref:lysoplasmalogenase n=1 Tax=Cytobacillus TaxID=2675230 RepID=UPI002040CF19|nr:lysoplasmalogenase [Cytobacillus oceanisediminis]MCM3245858.1 lysoplasmalogenase [Cytobacillus oceanisediminis]MCS0825148.1 lysoplasmalogenase [Cytobacillus firmus]
MKNLLIPILIGLMAFLYIFIIPQEPLAMKVVFKLIPMALIIIYAFRKLPASPSPALRLVVIGLFFCMLGDGFIAVSFVAGLGAFLVGHLFYLTGFLKMADITKLRLAAIIPIGLYSWLIGRQLIASIAAEGIGMLMMPFIAYMLVISIMALSAILTGSKWAIAGSLLFVISDSILSWNMFVSGVFYSDVFIMTTYYSAQFLIACSLSSFGKREATITAKSEVIRPF